MAIPVKFHFGDGTYATCNLATRFTDACGTIVPDEARTRQLQGAAQSLREDKLCSALPVPDPVRK